MTEREFQDRWREHRHATKKRAETRLRAHTRTLMDNNIDWRFTEKCKECLKDKIFIMYDITGCTQVTIGL